jgi:hypothetical protein
MRPERQHVTPRDRPLFLRPNRAKLSLSLRTSLLTIAFLFALWLGSVVGSAWVTSHPCLVTPGGRITLILGPKSIGSAGENRQDIACGLDGKVKWIVNYVSAESSGEVKP